MADLTVLMHDVVAGNLVRLSNGGLRFDYDQGYRGTPAATPMSLSMPLEVRSHPDNVVTPWLWGLLPEDDAVLRRWGRQFQVSHASPFALLGTPIGEDCAGAVRFCPPSETDRLLERTGDVEWLDDRGVESRIRDLRVDATAWLGTRFTGQFSLAGAQAKTALYHDGERWGVPSGATPTTHILKPAIRGFDDHEVNEHLCLDAARRVGLGVVATRVERFGKERAIVVTRYDRQRTNDGPRRIHQEDLCQALGVSPQSKYQNEGGPSPLAVIRLLRRSMPPSVAATAIDHFVDALIWNWIIGGTDGHAKNYSLLLAAKDARLAPLYDIASALPYGVHERKLRMAMKIGGDYQLHALRDRWSKAAAEWDLDAERLTARVIDLAERAPDAFADSAAQPPVRGLGAPGVDTLVRHVTSRAARCLSQLN